MVDLRAAFFFLISHPLIDINLIENLGGYLEIV